MPVSKLLKFPIGSYLIVRLDYVIICDDELEAKILRLIEMYMDDERKGIYRNLLNDPKNELTPDMVVEITKDVWVSISHRLFMNDLYGQVKSENTLKRAIKSLTDRELIRVKPGTHKYEAPRYQIDTERVQAELDKLARLGKVEYQKLMVSKIDGIKKSSHQKVTPSGYQKLPPSSEDRVSEIDTNSRRGYGNKDTVEERENASALAPTRAPSVSLAEESETRTNDGLAILPANILQPIGGNPGALAPAQSRTAGTGQAKGLTSNDGLDTRPGTLEPVRSSAPLGDVATHREAGGRDGQLSDEQTSPALSNDDAARTSPSGPRASGGRKPREKPARTPQPTKEPEPEFVLTDLQMAFWQLWCEVWFNVKLPPKLTEKAYQNVVTLAPLIQTAGDMKSLVKRAKKDLKDRGINQASVELGNLKNSYRGWLQSQAEDDPESAQPDASQRDERTSDFDKYVGNGKEARARLDAAYDELERTGQLAW